MILRNGTPSTSAAICPSTVSDPVPRSVAPTRRLNEPSSFILMVDAAMSILGIPEPCIWTDMPMPRRTGPSSAGRARFSAQPKASMPASRHSLRAHDRIVMSTPSPPSPISLKTGEVSPERM